MTYPAKDTSLPEASTRVRLKVEYDRASRTQEGRGRSWANSYSMRRRKSAKTMSQSAFVPDGDQWVEFGTALDAIA